LAKIVPVKSGRLEAFSDGVLAIIITIMVLELLAPEAGEGDSATFADLWESGLGPVFLSYLLSFAYIAIYWNNHHHVMAMVKRVTPAIMWANMLLLFSLSLIPFSMSWVGEHPLEPAPTVLYGLVLLLSGCCYYLLVRVIVATHPKDSPVAQALGTDRKGQASLVSYLLAVVLAFFLPGIATAILFGVAVLWIIPDRRIERALSAGE
jgi:uncharacterized membrane protein